MIRQTALFAAASLLASSASATLIDDYSGDLSNYTTTVILDNNGGASNAAAFEISGGALQLNTTSYDGIEQYAFIYNGLSLAVGEEVQIDVTHNGGNQDVGLYVGGTMPTTGVRTDYVSVYARGTGELFSRGFDGGTEYGLAGPGVVTYDTLFIARTAANTYEAGYYDGVTRNIIITRTPTTANDGEFVGIYADVRGQGIVGTLDNLTVIPEPGSLALLGLGGLALARRRRA